MAILKSILNYTLVPLIRYLRQNTTPPPPCYNVLDEVLVRAVRSAADYVETHMPMALSFRTRELLWDFALSKRMPKEGLIAEFGVFEGYSINHIASKCNQTIYGFDSFEGLQEDWAGCPRPKGSFNLNGKVPAVLENVVLIKGWFDKTLPEFLAKNEQPLTYLHLDADTYTATKTVLELISHRIVRGTVIVFDEYFGYPGWKEGEYKAWQELVTKNKIEYEYLCFSSMIVAIRIK